MFPAMLDPTVTKSNDKCFNYLNDDYLLETEPKILEINPSFTKYADKVENTKKVNIAIDTFLGSLVI